MRGEEIIAQQRSSLKLGGFLYDEVLLRGMLSVKNQWRNQFAKKSTRKSSLSFLVRSSSHIKNAVEFRHRAINYKCLLLGLAYTMMIPVQGCASEYDGPITIETPETNFSAECGGAVLATSKVHGLLSMSCADGGLVTYSLDGALLGRFTDARILDPVGHEERAGRAIVYGFLPGIGGHLLPFDLQVGALDPIPLPNAAVSHVEVAATGDCVLVGRPRGGGGYTVVAQAFNGENLIRTNKAVELDVDGFAVSGLGSSSYGFLRCVKSGEDISAAHVKRIQDGEGKGGGIRYVLSIHRSDLSDQTLYTSDEEIRLLRILDGRRGAMFVDRDTRLGVFSWKDGALSFFNAPNSGRWLAYDVVADVGIVLSPGDGTNNLLRVSGVLNGKQAPEISLIAGAVGPESYAVEGGVSGAGFVLTYEAFSQSAASEHITRHVRWLF